MKKLLFLLIAIAITLVACNRNDDELKEDNALSSMQLSYSTSEIMNALGKATIVTDDAGYQRIVEQSGKDIGISEELFLKIQRIISNTNRYIHSKDIRYRRILTRSTDQKSDSTKNDCLGWTIYNAMKTLGLADSISQEEIWNDLSSKYMDKSGYGIDFDKLGNALGDYFEYDMIDPTQIDEDSNWTSTNSGGVMMGVFSINGGACHSMTIEGIRDNHVLVRDDQNQTYDTDELIWLDSSCIKSMYFVWPK